jgi:AraC family transcriptional regulator of adaptative response/methylated-DNA-[protein]-cysteine methyltransferase
VPAGRAALQAEFPAARHRRDDAAVAPVAAAAVGVGADPAGRPKLLMTGTNFQVQVWRALLAIPPGHVVSYGAIARAVGRPKASRAVGAAIGRNPISLLVPCHRVIQANGAVHNYRWGPVRKRVLLGWEAGNRMAAAGAVADRLSGW